MIADGLIDAINWIIQNWIYPLFPSNYPLLSYETYSTTLSGLQTNISFAFSTINRFFPITLLLAFLGLILTAEITLIGIKVGMWLVNLIRGSGA